MIISRRKKIIAAFLGTIVEYYDYSLYAFSANIIAQKIFPNIDFKTALMNIFGIYALSYFAKPFGALFFSYIGDKYGRKNALKVTIIGIAIPTLIIGLLPSYQSIGTISIFIVAFCRFFQGFFVGGEYDGAAIYVIEHLGKKYHYTSSAIARATGVLGLLLGIASTNFFNSSIFPAWGWRIPFLLSLPLAALTIYYRKYLEETPAFLSAKQSNFQFTAIGKFISKKWPDLLMVVLLAGSFGATYQIAIIFNKQYLPIIMTDSRSIITSFSVLIVLIFGMTMPIAGFLADKFGLKKIINYSIILACLSSCLFIIAFYAQLLNLLLLASALLAISVAPFNALAHGVMIKLFSVSERYRGISLSHNLGSMLFSGTANFICLYFMQLLNFNLFPICYLILFAAISLLIMRKIDRKFD